MHGNEANLKEALFKFDDIMKDFKVNYVLTKGTLLGAYRNNCLLPWDEDIDVEVPIGNREAYASFEDLDVFKILRAAKRVGFTDVGWGHEFNLHSDIDFFIDPNIGSLPIDEQWNTFVKTDTRWKFERGGMSWKGSHPSIELLKERDNKVHVDCFMCIQNIHSCYKPIYDLDNAIQKIRLYDRYFYIPSNPEQYLNKQYGSTWKDIFCNTELWLKHCKEIEKGNIPEDVKKYMESFNKLNNRWMF